VGPRTDGQAETGRRTGGSPAMPRRAAPAHADTWGRLGSKAGPRRYVGGFFMPTCDMARARFESSVPNRRSRSASAMSSRWRCFASSSCVMGCIGRFSLVLSRVICPVGRSSGAIPIRARQPYPSRQTALGCCSMAGPTRARTTAGQARNRPMLPTLLAGQPPTRNGHQSWALSGATGPTYTPGHAGARWSGRRAPEVNPRQMHARRHLR
jgi:hypothetical protein